MVTFDYILFITITIGYLLGAASFLIGFLKTPYFKNGNRAKPVFISILIAARNEEDTLPFLLEDLLNQDYPKELLEVIVVDDHSTDNTAKVVQAYAEKGVRLIQLNESSALNSYKKKAISTAIDQSRGDFIITTDADCRVGPNWVKSFSEYYQNGKYKLISAPVGFLDTGKWFQKFQSMEFSMLIGLGAGAIQNHNPFTCNGANLGYEKKTFYELGGFKGIDDLASGDDELFLHKVAIQYPQQIGFLKNREAIVYTHAKEDIKDFIKQRRRWASKSVKYKNRIMIMVAVWAFIFNISILLNGLLVWFFPILLPLLVFQVLVKMVLETLLMFSVLHFLKQSRYIGQLFIFLPLYFLTLMIYMAYIGLAGNSGKYEWKGRMVR